MPQTKPVAPSCERNRDPILKVLKKVIPSEDRALLEIGSGTGQHAVYFAPHFPQLQWYTSDVAAQHAGIRAWLDEAQLSNVHGPPELEIGRDQLQKVFYEIIFSANVLHIISWEKCQILFKMLGDCLTMGAQVLFYGPFNYGGQFTSESNSVFDQWLKSRDIESGIRNFEDVRDLMMAQGFILRNDYEMPSNNRILHFKKN